MNETLQPYVKKLLDGGMKTAEDVFKFIETQTPELGKEVIVWGSVSEMVAPLFGLIVLISALFLHVKCRKTSFYYDTQTGDPPLALLTIAMTLVGFFIFISEVVDVIYPIIAPRLYILEKISTLIK